MWLLVFDLSSSHRFDDIHWLDTNPYGKAKEFGCEERKIWVYLDGIKNHYSRSPRSLKRPKYLLEAFWKSRMGADDFRAWSMSADGDNCGKNRNDTAQSHSVLRHIDFGPVQNVRDD